MRYLTRGFLLLRYAFLLLLLAQERHHLRAVLLPTVSIGWSCAASRMARNLWRPDLFSSIHSLRELAGLNLRQNLLHLLARLGR